MSVIRGYATSTIGRPRQKFNNIPTMRGVIRFASKKEAARYDQLCLLEKNGELRKLRLQVKFPLKVNGFLVCNYIADFVYEERVKGTALELPAGVRWIWREVVEDVKGYATPAYRLKKKLLKALLGVEIRET